MIWLFVYAGCLLVVDDDVVKCWGFGVTALVVRSLCKSCFFFFKQKTAYEI